MAIRDYRPATQAPGPAGTPQINLGVAGDTSGAQNLGNAISNAGLMLEEANQAVELNDARLEMGEGLSALNRELATDTDFGTMQARYDTRLADLKTGVMGKVKTPRIQSQMALEMQRGRIGAEAQIMRRQQELEGSHARATLSRTLRTTASYIPTADSSEAKSESYNRALASIGQLEQSGHLSPEEAEKWRTDLDRDVSTGLALGAINDDPAAAAAALAEPGAYGLEEIERQRYLATATRQAESTARTGRTILERQVDTARGVLVRGGTVAAEDLAALKDQVKGTDLAVPLEAALQASAELGNFTAATPQERAGHLDAVRARGVRIDDATIGTAQIATLEAVDAAIGRAETDALKTTGEAVRAAVIAFGDGREVADIAEVRAAARGTEFEADLKLAERRKEFVEDYAKADRTDQDRLLKDARASGVITANRTADEAFLDTLESIDSTAATAIAKDPIKYAMDNRVAGAAALDLGDPASIDARMALVQEMTGQYDAPPMIFSEEERKSFKAVANDGTPEEQLAFVVSVIDGFGPGSEAVFKEIDGLDPIVARAGELVFETGSDEVAGIILQGRKAMQSGDELTAPSEAALQVFSDSIDGVLASMPGRREEVIEAAKAYYAVMAPGRITPETPFRDQTALLAEGVQRVMGGVKIKDKLYGGIQPVNGKRVKLPATLDSDAVEKMFGGASLEHWKSGSLSGNAPHEGAAETLPKDAVLQWVKGSVYRVGVQSRRGAVEWYQDPAMSNGFFYVDLSAMAKDFLKKPNKTDGK
jgi:hypothetical protein